jgi:tetratricopeptide (TPR) repeat protein
VRRLRLALLFGLVLLVPGRLRAEDWDLTRPGQGGRSRGARTTPQRPRPAVQAAPSAARNDATSDVLAERYVRLLLGDPLHAFALERLLALYRERDGNLDRLAAELAVREAREGDATALWLLRGHVEAARGDRDAARAAFARAAEQSPQAVAPLLLRAGLERDGGDHELAGQLLEQALALSKPGRPRADVLRQLGELALERQDFEQAERRYAALAAAQPGGVFEAAEYARALAARGHHARAAQAYARAIAAQRGDDRVLPPLLLEQARAQLDAGDGEAALASLERARKLAPAGSGVRSEIDDVMVEAHRRDGRLPELAERLAREQGGGFAHSALLGKLYDELGEHARARDALRRAIAQNPRHVESRQRLIQILTRQGEIDAAIAEYRALVRIAPREPRFVVELGRLLMESGKRAEALALLEQTGRRFAGDARIHRALFDVYARWKEPERAAQELAHLSRIEPDDPAHWMALGEHLLEQGDEAKALAAWRKILGAGDDKASAHAALGSVLLDHDMPERALAEYEAAVRLQPEEIEYLRGLAETLERLQRSSEAAERWQQVLALSSDRALRREARRRVVRLWSVSGELQRRIAEFERAFAPEGNGKPDVEAGRFLAEGYRVLAVGRRRSLGDPRKLDAAERVLSRVIELEPGDIESLLSLERLRAARGDLDGAISVLRRLLEADPRNAPTYLSRMAEHALAAYRDDDAVEYAERLTKLNPNDARAHERLGDLYRARQNTTGAIASYERAVALDGNAFGVMLQLSELQLSRGEVTEADAVLRRVLRACPDDELVRRAGRSLLQLHLGTERMAALEQALLPLALNHAQRPVYRNLLVELFEASARPLIETAREAGPGAAAARSQLAALGQRAIKPLLEALADADPAQNRIAVELLGHLHNAHAAVPLLRAAEREGDTPLRRRALLGAGAVAGAELAPRFAVLASAPERRLRDAAAWSLARMSGAAVVRELRELLASSTPAVRGYALLGLGGLRDGPSVEAMRKALRGDRHAFARGAAALALGMMQDRSSAPALSTALRTEQGDPAMASAVALGLLGDRALAEALAEAVFTSDPALRAAALWSMRWLARAGRPQAPSLPEPAEPEERLTLEPVIGAWLALPPPAELAEAITAFELELREAAQAALQGAPDATRAALALLSGRDAALIPAGERGVPARLLAPLLPVIARLGEHPDPAVRAASLELLASADAGSAAGPLLQALGDGDSAVQTTALAAIGPAVAGSPEALARLSAMARDDTRWWMRRRAAEALGRASASASVVTALLQVLRADPYAYVREAAADALGRLRAPAAVAALADALASDPEPAVRSAAARALQRIGGPDAQRALQRAGGAAKVPATGAVVP